MLTEEEAYVIIRLISLCSLIMISEMTGLTKIIIEYLTK